MCGLLLRKLMEEVLTGELAEEVGQFASRIGELLTSSGSTSLFQSMTI